MTDAPERSKILLHKWSSRIFFKLLCKWGKVLEKLFWFKIAKIVPKINYFLVKSVNGQLGMNFGNSWWHIFTTPERIYQTQKQNVVFTIICW